MRKGSQCKTFSHIDTATGEKVFRDKTKYLKPESASIDAQKLNDSPKQIHKVYAYKCTSCHFFHVGRVTEII